MNDERNLILKLLEDGKINADEAEKLLISLRKKESNDDRDKDINYNKYKDKDIENVFRKFEDEVEPFLRNIGQKVEPSIRGFGDKTVGFVENIVSNVSRSNVFDRAYSFKEFEIDANEISNSEIYLKSFADKIHLSGYSGNKIIIKVYYKSHRYDEKDISLKNLDNRILLHYDEDKFEAVRVDAKIPRNFFDKIVLASNGVGRRKGKLVVSNVLAEKLDIKTSFSNCQIMNLHVKELKINSVDSDLNISNTRIGNLLLDISNSKIAIALSDIRKKDITSIASVIKLNVMELFDFSEYDWFFDLKFSKFDFRIYNKTNIGLDIYAEAINGKVNTNLSNMESRKSGILSKDSYYDGISKKFIYCTKKLFLDIHSENSNINLEQ